MLKSNICVANQISLLFYVYFYLYSVSPTHLMVPANRGLKAYSQSCISLSLVACSRIPRCSVHTANVLGVWKHEVNEAHQVYCTTIYSFIYKHVLLLSSSSVVPAVRSACLRCIPPWQTTGWWQLSPRCPSRCDTGRRRAGAPPRSASPSRWCGAPGSAGSLSLTQ